MRFDGYRCDNKTCINGDGGRAFAEAGRYDVPAGWVVLTTTLNGTDDTIVYEACCIDCATSVLYDLRRAGEAA